MALYRHGSTVVEGIETSIVIALARHTWHALPEWFRSAHLNGAVQAEPDHVTVKTPLGTVRAEMSDFVVRDAKGELVALKPDEFARAYEAAE